MDNMENETESATYIYIYIYIYVYTYDMYIYIYIYIYRVISEPDSWYGAGLRVSESGPKDYDLGLGFGI